MARVAIEPMTTRWQTSTLSTKPRGFLGQRFNPLSSCSSSLAAKLRRLLPRRYLPYWVIVMSVFQGPPAECNPPIHSWLYYTPGETNEHPCIVVFMFMIVCSYTRTRGVGHLDPIMLVLVFPSDVSIISRLRAVPIGQQSQLGALLSSSARVCDRPS